MAETSDCFDQFLELVIGVAILELLIKVSEIIDVKFSFTLGVK